MALRYATKIWLLSVLLSPVLYMLGMAVTDLREDYLDVFYAILFLQILGGIFSLPNYVALILFSKNIFKHSSLINERRKQMTLVTIALWLLLFSILEYLVPGFFFKELLAFPYLFTLLIGVWYFEVFPNNTKNSLSEYLLDDDVTLND